MTGQSRIERTLPTLLDGLAGADASDVLDHVLASTTSMRQRPARAQLAWWLPDALTGPRAWPAGGPRGFVALPAGARIAIVFALLLALLAGVAYAGSQLLRSIMPPRPAGAPSFVITDSWSCPGPSGGTVELPGATVVDIETAAARRMVECADGLLLAPDGLRAVAAATDHLELIDLRDGSRRAIAGTQGLAPEPIAWSPKGTYLYWLGDSAAGTPTTVFLGPLNDARRTRPPSPSGGGYSSSPLWSANESRVLFPSGDENQWMSGNGDGTGLRAASGVGTSLLAVSPDGSSIAVSVERANAAGDMLATDVAVGDGFSTPRNVTTFPDGTGAVAAAWSPDGSTLAVVSTSRSQPATPTAPATNDLWLVASDGSRRHVGLPPAEDPVAGGSVRWAADGAHLAIGLHTIRRDGQQEIHNEGFVIVAAADGAFAPSTAWTNAPASQVWFAPDGSRVAYHDDFRIEVLNLDGSGSRSVSLIDLPAVSFGGQLVWSP